MSLYCPWASPDQGSTRAALLRILWSLHDDGKLTSFKLRSNPASPASVILEGLRRVAAKRAEVVHGSTVATNALLERKGAKTAFVTTRGFEDLIAIGRQNRPELYNLTPALPRPLVPRELCFGVEERVLFDGSVERSRSGRYCGSGEADVDRARNRWRSACCIPIRTTRMNGCC